MAVQFATFTSSKYGLQTAGREARMLEEANHRAQQWINSKESFYIISISTCLGAASASTTVWYDDNPS